MREILYRGKEAEKDRSEGMQWLTLAAQARYARVKIELALIQLKHTSKPECMSTMMEVTFGSLRTLELHVQE